MVNPIGNDELGLSTIYENSMIITQPRRSETIENETHPNEEINNRISSNVENNTEPRITRAPLIMNWISMSRGILSSLSPEYLLSNIEQLEIQPVVDVSAYTNNRQYRVKCRDRSETLFLATEYSIDWQKNVLGSIRRLRVILRDASGATSFTLMKGVSTGYVPGFLHKMTVETPTQLLGNIQQNFTCYGVKFTINEALTDNDQRVATVNGPNMHYCCYTMKNANFQVSTLDGSNQIASIMHQWDYLLLDYVSFVTFPAGMDVKLKSLILGAAFLLESLYFNR